MSDDLIRRQDAIDAVKGRFSMPVDSLIVEVIGALPSAQPKPQWIPCIERLPEHDGEKYLVTLYCDRINVVSVRISYCYMNRDGFWSDVPLGYKVTAWMPLPEPWKGAER